MLLVLSENPINSAWVRNEVEASFREERKQGRVIMAPLMIDRTALESEVSWVEMLKDQRFISNFTDWKNYDSYKKSFKRLLRDIWNS